MKKKLFFGLAISASICAQTNFISAFAEEVYSPGVSVTENKESKYDGDYTVRFVYKDTNDEKVARKVVLTGNFQFADKNDEAIKNGDLSNMKIYSAYEYKNGMFNHTNSPIEYNLDVIGDESDELFSVEIPLPGNLYYYDYTVTYADGSQETIEDPANKAVGNGAHTSNHSLVVVGDKEHCAEGQEFIYANSEQKGTVEYVTYTATDGTEQPLGVYLPYQYDPEKTYKTIYLSHGGGGNEAEWMTIGAVPNIMDNLIAEGKAEEAVVVTMDHTYFEFDYEICKKNMEENIIPYIEEHYSVSKNAEDRAFGGLSRPSGGRMLTVGFAHEWTEKFGYYYLNCSTLGDVQIKDAEAMKQAGIYLNVGSVDILALPDAKAVHSNLEEAQVEHRFDIIDGGHDWALWRKSFTVFVSEILWQ